MSLKPCDTCPRFTYNGKNQHGDRLCDPCRDALAFVRTQPVDDLRDLVTPPRLETTCRWLEDRCELPAVGDAGHPVHGVIPICRKHRDAFSVPLITTYDGVTA